MVNRHKQKIKCLVSFLIFLGTIAILYKQMNNNNLQISEIEESQGKTSKYSKNDWENIMQEAGAIYEELYKLMDKDPSDEKVQELIQKWRNHITTNFYNCTIEIFRGLALMYVGDERFTKNIDKYGEGLAKFMSDAMNIYCDNNTK